ncbi:MAG: hypothetical protein NZ898_11280 [Myxococcota bacterium]|nr:hypothetical protein [Myxococcota bacterium]MDW8363341.1 hypothetical protein [Myxococcales bacterium]
MSDRAPTSGRVEILLLEADEHAATYRVLLHAADRCWQADACITDTVALGPFAPGDAPPWLADDARGFLRTLAAQRRRGETRWPRRLHRWRAAPGTG